MSDQSQIEALAERMKRNVSVLHLNAHDAAMWEKSVRICAREALRWRDETRPEQAAPAAPDSAALARMALLFAKGEALPTRSQLEAAANAVLQAPTTEAVPVGRYSVGLVADGTGHCILLDGVECGGQWSENDAETIVRALNSAMRAAAKGNA
jgi:hypothetical protein